MALGALRTRLGALLPGSRAPAGPPSPGAALAATLRAALLARRPELRPAAVAADAFAPAVAAMDAADGAYRAAVARSLARAPARGVLEATDAFRGRVRAVRADAAPEFAAAFARAGEPGAAWDALDLLGPRGDRLTHVDATRLASAGDRARERVAGYRAEANARIAPLLGEPERAALVAAKTARVAAFRGAVHAAVVPLLGGEAGRVSATIEDLASLAGDWY